MGLRGMIEVEYRELPRHDRRWAMRVTGSLFGGYVVVDREWGRRNSWSRRHRLLLREDQVETLLRSVLGRRLRNGYRVVRSSGEVAAMWADMTSNAEETSHARTTRS